MATTNPEHPLFDETRYDLWVDATEQERKSAIARTASVLGANVLQLRSQMDAGQPVAQGVPLEEAAALRRRLSVAGLRVRVQPEPPVPWDQLDLTGKVSCDVCGKPGEPNAHPNAPVTAQVLCPEHAATVSSFNPVALLMWMVFLAVIAFCFWSIFG